jgi:dipeptidyl-peptidase 4
MASSARGDAGPDRLDRGPVAGIIMEKKALLVLLIAATAACAQPAGLQQPAPAPGDAASPDVAALYARAERLLSWNVNLLAVGASVQPQWLEGDRFWYRNRVADGHEFVVVDPERETRERAFDHARLAAALSEATGRELSPLDLPLQALRPTQDGRGLGFELDRRRWECDVMEYRCERPASPVEEAQNAVLSPDRRLAVFRRDHDLWVRDMTSGEERALTTDGVDRYGYATDNEGWRRSERPAVRWSPDSRRVATYRLDERGVGEMHLWEMAEGRPQLHSWPYALPGDTVVPMYERIIIDVQDSHTIRLPTPPDHQRTSSCCGMMRGDAWGDAEWSEDGRWLAFTSVSRDYNTVTLRLADATTGEVRDLLTESLEPFFEGSAAGRGGPNWRVLHDRGELLWYSPRDDWSHLYLYDLSSGQQIRRLTAGDWSVIDVMHVDEDAAFVYFTAAGREPGRNPYHRHLYRVSLEGGEPDLLTPEEGDHVVSMAPSGRFFVASRSTVDTPPVTVLRQADGEPVMTVEEADISRLVAAGWPAPIPFTATARDGVTEIHGLMFRPSDFDPEQRYPIINRIYPGPQVGSIGPRTFQAARGGNSQALAELGFVVVQIDALGTPMRSADLHAHYYGDLADNGLPDQIAAMRQLAERHPWIDLSRVGIFGHSGGGFATAAALLRHPDFFHVGVASAGNLDNRGYTYYWGEKWHGPLEPLPDGTDTYTNQALHLLAENLQGRLLLAYGTMDANVHPNMTLLLINELIRHNKDFDVVVMPNRGHGFANEPFFIRKTWDHFVRHLLDLEPPREFGLREGS